MSASLSTVIEPLIRRKIFSTEEEAIRELTREYVLRQIDALQRKAGGLERKYGMRFQRFGEYLHERSVLLERGTLSQQQRRALSQAIMREEDDWLEWKAAQEMLESWLGLHQEVTA